MNVLVVGSGGREHAFIDALSRAQGIGRLVAAPGNAGIAEQAECVEVPLTDTARQVALAKDMQAGLVVVGPEGPLVAGLVDGLQAAGIPALGPTRAAAHIEGSKAYMKDLCRRARIPTAGCRTFSSSSEAIAHAESLERWPTVIKADGLAAGKGVVIVHDAVTAVATVRSMMLEKTFGESGSRVLFEEFVEGEELSIMALVDGETVAVLEPSRDHKAVGDGDTGPNTGGMGAFSPSRLLTRRTYEQIEERVLIPAVHSLSREGRPFRGILYAGLMLTGEGPVVLEFNARGGDPEIEALMPRLESDALKLFHAAATAGLAEHGEIRWSRQHACAVVLADGDYPGAVKPGKPIEGLERAAALPNVHIYHMGTRRTAGRLETAGGRVLCVTGLGADLPAARRAAYAAVTQIHFPGMRYRRDIGWRELDRTAGPVVVDGGISAP
ncbi:MAG: phosphoribosylamine--glycine ligase [Planctomycetota bacterium]